ncbi:trichodiene oxygenase [Colletotrichum incanum]|nr:trichodiene oxygenase [Colletotrichum incanum]
MIFSTMVLYCGVVTLLFWLLAKSLYNIFLHPLRNIAGLWYSFAIFDRDRRRIVLSDASLGPVVRITPEEVLINHIDAFTKIYSQGSKFDKAHYFYQPLVFQVDNLFTMCDRSQHAQDKRLLSHNFSKKGERFSLDDTFQYLTLDLRCEFAFGVSANALDSENFRHPIIETLELANHTIILVRGLSYTQLNGNCLLPQMPQFPALPKIARLIPGLPDSTVRLAQVRLFVPAIRPRISANIPIPFSDAHLVEEGVLMLVAGTDATAVSLATTMHYVLQQPELYEKLWEEVQHVIGDSRPLFNDLDAFPLLDACIKEGLRLSCQVRARMPRVVPEDGWTFNGQFFKPGTIVSASPLFLMRDPTVLPSPETFNPNRWITADDQQMTKMLHYFHPFSRGSRQCIGKT